MEKFFNKTNIKNLLFSCVYAVLGILFLVMLGNLIDFCESVICFVMIIFGAILVLAYSFMPQDNKIFKVLIYGIICVACGIFILVFPRFFVLVLSIYIGYSGVLLILEAKKDKTPENKAWISELVIGIIILGFAITCAILSNTHIARNIIAIILGVTFLIEAIYNIITLILAVKKSKTL